jgi:hypothetical protein
MQCYSFVLLADSILKCNDVPKTVGRRVFNSEKTVPSPGLIARNAQGQVVLEGILNSVSQTVRRNRFGGQNIFDTITGRGARFGADGEFIGFLDP